MAQQLTLKAIADELGEDPRVLRRFLREEVKENGGKVGDATPGKGGRYTFSGREAQAIRRRFTAWRQGHQVRQAA